MVFGLFDEYYGVGHLLEFDQLEGGFIFFILFRSRLSHPDDSRVVAHLVAVAVQYVVYLLVEV